ncbi:MAG: leader peptidase (prepilin peptidase) / N-methyltransferase [bacterium]|jgi:leader peptidase (prepilin peptidase)/N-methyltransferase
MFFGILLAALGGLFAGSLAHGVALRLVRGEPLLRGGGEPPADREEPSAGRERLVKVTTAALFVLVAAVQHDDSTRLVLGLAMVGFLVALTLVDLKTRLLPNKLTLPAAVTAIVLGLLVDASGEPERLLAGAVAGGFFLVVALAYPSGMGLGDVKLAAVLGLFLGREVAAALLFALVAGVLVGVAIMRRKGVAEGRKTAVAFGPFLALGAVAALLVGEGLVAAYLASF